MMGGLVKTKKDFNCNYCDYKMENKYTLKDHLDIMHFVILTITPSGVITTIITNNNVLNQIKIKGLKWKH